MQNINSDFLFAIPDGLNVLPRECSENILQDCPEGCFCQVLDCTDEWDVPTEVTPEVEEYEGTWWDAFHELGGEG